MKNILQILQGIVPAPASGTVIRRDGFAVLKSAGTALPEGFPDAMSRDKMLKESGSVAAFRSGSFFCKVYKFRNILHSLKRTFRTPRAFRCFAGAQLLLEHGFHTPEPIGAAVRYSGIVPLYQVLVTAGLPEDAVYLNKFVKQADLQNAGELLIAATGFAAKLHQAGFVHGDMSLRNIYFMPDAKSFGLIDLDGMVLYPGGVPQNMAAREVARLISSAYRCCQQPDIPREEWLLTALQSYRESGGADLQKKDVAGTIARLGTHRYHGR